MPHDRTEPPLRCPASASSATTADRFRRSLIGHYVQADARQVAAYYHPALRMDGSHLTLEVSDGGGACGEWTEHDGAPAIAMTGRHAVARAHE